MYLILGIVQVLVFSVTLSLAADTACEESQKHFANLCFSPNPLGEIDLKWSIEKQPADGWHAVQGNDVTKLHLSENLQGKLIESSDSIEKPCFRARVEHGDNPEEAAPDGKFFGFENSTIEWNCTYSKDFPGVLLCDFDNRGVSKYHESMNLYVSHSDNKNLQIAILCFPTGQVGWVVMSISKSLTDEEQKTISNHVTELGFSNDNTVSLFEESQCS